MQQLDLAAIVNDSTLARPDNASVLLLLLSHSLVQHGYQARDHVSFLIPKRLHDESIQLGLLVLVEGLLLSFSLQGKLVIDLLFLMVVASHLVY